MSAPGRVPRLQAPGEALLPWEFSRPDLARMQAKPCWSQRVLGSCGAFEWVTFAYLVWLETIVVLFHRNIRDAGRLFALHVLVAAAIIWLVISAAPSKSEVLRFLRHWYPLPLYIFFFEELGRLVHAIFPGWFDGWLVAFDHALTGVHPSVWLARFSTPRLNDFMQFAYMTYFLDLVVLPAILYARREGAAFWTVMTSTAVANYSIYAIAILLPIESPFYSLASLETRELDGGASTALIGLIERFGRVHGAAFPSAHVAGATVALLGAWRYRRWLFWICLPFFLCLSVATVYGRYHYVADVLAGFVVGCAALALGSRLTRSRSSGLGET